MKMKSDNIAILFILVLIASVAFMAKDHIAAAAGNTTIGANTIVLPDEHSVIVEKMKPLGVDSPLVEKNASREEICMAQILFSESKNKIHWIYIGWTARNRVDMKFRGDSYCEVAHWPSQFTAISHKSDPGHNRITQIHKRYVSNKLTQLDKTIWENAIGTARIIINADEILNPVPDAVFFWYVPAYDDGAIQWPKWAMGKPAPYILRKQNSKDVAWAFYRIQDTV